MVKQLMFCEKELQVATIYPFDSLKTFMAILQAMFHGLPEEIELTGPFIKWSELVYRHSMGSNILTRQCHTALETGANTLVNKYPNVSSISHVTLTPHEFMQKMIAELAVGYDKQLTEFNCEMPAIFPYTLLAPNLVDLDLRLYTSSNPNLPAICPRSLRKIKLIIDTHLFSWDMFCADMESEAIVFDNLEELSIIDAVQNGVEGDMIANNLNLEFPKLEKLYLANICLTGKDVQAIMGHELQQFHYEGSIIAASNMCKQPLGNLDKLYLQWERELYLDEADNFVPLTNEIFNKMNGIGYVHYEISSVDFAESVDGIDWPYLTHLSLTFMMPFNKLFGMVSNVPNLVYLDMNVGGYYRNELVEATKFLTDIKEHYPEPSSSKIETLCLAGQHGPSCSFPCCQQPFRKAIENLKWYWPQLKDIEFQEN
ncbi:hypothetical protein GGH96_003094 [Coemansia sp. RSA 1972]|nr:hypothetical protein GGH96_003094 [Coemansia sp. RSA 1972]